MKQFAGSYALAYIFLVFVRYGAGNRQYQVKSVSFHIYESSSVLYRLPYL